MAAIATVADIVSYFVSRTKSAATAEGMMLSAVVVGGYVRNRGFRHESLSALLARPVAPHDVNIYFFIADGARLHEAIRFHGETTRELTEVCAATGLILIIDSHPFVTPTHATGFGDDMHAFLQLTTNVFGTSDLHQSIPWHCLKSWYSGYEVLAGPNPFAMKRDFPTHRDTDWLVGKARALVDYHNVLRRLQFGVSHGPARIEVLFHQAYLYLWEIIKDGLGIALTDGEFLAGQETCIREGATHEIETLFQSRFGGAEVAETCVTAVRHARRIKAEYFNLRHHLAEAQLSIRLGMELCEHVYARLTALIAGGCNAGAADYVRALNKFSLWY